MTARWILSTWKWRLVAVIVFAALGVATALGILALVVAGALGASHDQAQILGLVVGVVSLLVDVGRRAKGRLTDTRVALWLEEHLPELEYSLVSAAEQPEHPSLVSPAVARTAADSRPKIALLRALVVPGLAVVLAAALLLLRQSSGAAHVLGPIAEAISPAAGNALARVTVTVRPPAYSGLPRQTMVNPDIVQPLVGSRVEVEGSLADTGDTLSAVIGETTLDVSLRDGRWLLEMASPDSAAVLRLRHGSNARLLVIEPRVDSIPVVTITSPARDTVLREAQGRFALRGHAQDDLGVASAAFEFIVSSGDGERFTFRSGTLGDVDGAGRRSVDLTAALDVRQLELKPGDVVHLRAVARDRNTNRGPEAGVSDTRAIRIARPGEYDSLAIEPAPPPEEDKTILSQRMLINLTEALVKRMPALGRDAVVAESRRISRDQARLRKQVSDIVFMRLGDDVSGEHFHGDGHAHGENEPIQGQLTPEQLLKAAERATEIHNEATDFAEDETPIVAINKPLLEAYNAMWEAGRALDGGQPREALPPMYAALAAIQKARAAERLYLRGLPPRVVVDLARVRLQGKERGSDAFRVSSNRFDDTRREALQRMRRALSLSDGGESADSLLLIRMSLIGRWPTAAATFDALIADVRAGRDATASVTGARRALESSVSVNDSIGSWGRVP